ncbi:MAG: sugar phosphate isomerase/epimerase [Verrucomicrobiales bacterium]|nr:sugar phosphate isomerase/epimerase [Verrucomicrobiales bacterium]
MSFSYTGFTDEAEKSLEGQISTLKEAGWSAIELRLLDGGNVCDQTEDQWKATFERLQEENIEIVGFGGQIGNWARPITSDFQMDLDELRRVAPRMREAGTKFLRIMSYPNPEENPLSNEDWKAETVRRLKELSTIAEGEGVILAHENSSGYGAYAEGWLELAEAVDSPALQLILDTGNNSLHDNDNEATWEFYEKTKSHITHVHIKSAQPNPEGGDWITCHVDEDPVQRRILQDLKNNGYEGWLSIEPHIKAAIHAGQDVDDSGEAREVWVEYTRRLEALVNGLD